MKQSQLFFNRCFDKNKLKSLISWSLRTYGEAKTLTLVEKLKDVGFFWATQAGISLSLDDLRIPKEKTNLLNLAEEASKSALNEFSRGNLTAVERLQQLIDAWHKTSELLKQEVVQNFRTSDPLNPVYMMAFSGARGNLSQVRQLVGMRGLMADPQGRIIDFPIRSNFREGLTLTEYVISCYGARKGLVDTALRTATSGYLTRRLVDVAQHVVVSSYDCESREGVLIFPLTQSSKVILSLQDRLLGRVLAEDIPGIAVRNQPISQFIAHKISLVTNQVLVRSPLSCKARNGICQLCYGWSLGHNELVSIGEAVGIIAAQSIGEPGTQLTMRTFHTGGVFSGEIIDQIESPVEGVISFPESFPGTLVRTSYGKIGFLTRKPGYLMIESNFEKGINSKFQKIDFPIQSILFVRQGQKILSNELLFEYASSSTDQDQGIQSTNLINSPQEGEIFFEDVVIIQEGEESENRADQLGSFWILAGKVMSGGFDSLGTFNLNRGDLLYEKASLATVNVKPFSHLKITDKKLKVSDSFLTTKSKSRQLPEFEYQFSSFSHSKVFYRSGSYLSSLELTKMEKTRFSTFSLLIQILENTSFNLVRLFLNYKKESPRQNKFGQDAFILFSNINFFEKYLKLNEKKKNVFFRKTISLNLHYFSKYTIVLNSFQSSSKHKKHKFSKGYFASLKTSPSILKQNNCKSYYHKSFNQNLLSSEKLKSKKSLPWIYKLKTNHLSIKKKFSKISCFFDLKDLSVFSFTFFNNCSYKFHLLSNLGSIQKLNDDGISYPTFQITKTYCYSLIEPRLIKLLIFAFLEKYSLKSVSVSNSTATKLKILNFTSFNSFALKPAVCDFGILFNPYLNEKIFNKQEPDKQLNTKKSLTLKFEFLPLEKQNPLANLLALRIHSLTPFSILKWHLNQKQFGSFPQLNLVGSCQIVLPNRENKFSRSSILKWKQSVNVSSFSPTIGKLNTLQKETGEVIRIKYSSSKLSDAGLILTRKDLFGIPKNYKNFSIFVSSLIRPGDEIDKNLSIEMPGQIVSIRRNAIILRKATPILFSSKATFHVFHKDFIKQGFPLITLSYRRLTTGDIVQGIPRIEQLFEARQTTTVLHDQLHELFENYKTRMRLDLAARKSFQKIQRILIDNIQKVYQTQGVMISDKHVEIIVRQMTSTVKILEGGRTRLLRGELKPIEWIERINSGIDTQKAEYEPVLLGITKASLETESFISAASFQETTRTLSRAAIEGKTDFLRGLKENVILGHRIPAGTGAPLITYLTKFQSDMEEDLTLSLALFPTDLRVGNSTKSFNRLETFWV